MANAEQRRTLSVDVHMGNFLKKPLQVEYKDLNFYIYIYKMTFAK